MEPWKVRCDAYGCPVGIIQRTGFLNKGVEK
jgi:hypothetical protein